MKAKKLMLALSASILLVAGCKDNEIDAEDSQYITMTSPMKNQEVQDSDSIRVDATIKPNSGAVASYQVYLLDKKGKRMHETKIMCGCADKGNVAIDLAFMYDVKKTSDMYIQVQAELEDGTRIHEEMPFRLVDTKK
ncbi:hypothetical protein [Dyadobacter sp. Leaf189]|uniref:hypothetical protein n=1 Tax=Dyadobacter sp. Leaf189 TaxID=1736295 RepID=UPI0006F4301E|nr:hypothetical protein [Dyadobacter sp. Leaf189]KQS24684.1 hypothetical protein ASG33_23265 [Dyadobacter sp. Leaf189]